MRNKIFWVVLASVLMSSLSVSDGFARWRDEGQSEKYFSFWEKKFQWEASAIEGYGLLLEQNYELARQKLEQAISLGCPLGKVYFQLGLCFDKLNKAEKAIENYTRSLDILAKGNEKDVDEYTFLAHHNLGVIWLEQGRDELAVKGLEQAAKIRPQDASTQINLGYLFSRNGMDEKAIEAYRQAIAHDPQSALAHFNLSVLLRRLGRAQEAQTHFERAQDLDSSIRGAVREVSESTEIKDPLSLTDEEIAIVREKAQGAEGLAAVGNLYLVRSQFEEALSFYDQALSVDPNAVGAHVGRGQALLGLGRPEEAQKAIFRVLELDPNHGQAHLQLGKVYYDLGRVQMARQEFEKAHAQNPHQAELLFYLGVVNEYQGDERYGEGFPAGEAISYYQKVLELVPDHLQARTNLGNVYARTGDWKSAKEQFELASSKAADSPYAHYNLGYIYDELGLRRQSIEEYLKAIKLDPRFADAYFNLGYVYSEYKLFRLSERQYYKVLDIDREYADAYFNLGVLYDKYLKDKGKAHTYYHEYALRRPNAPLNERKILKKRIIKLYP